MRKNISSLHLPHNKHTASCEPIRITPPEQVVLPMNMHSGSAAIPTVKPGDHVYVGQRIADEGERFSSPVHATVSGTVEKIEPIPQPDGKEIPAIFIRNDGKMEADPELKVPEIHNCDEFLQAIRDGGMVGLGGAAFPTWAKLNEARNKNYTVDTVLINAAECEPYITSDHHMMLDHPDLVVKGVNYLKQYMAEYLKDARYMICIEKNKPDAIEKMREAFAGDDTVVIHELDAVYPQGAKQVMLYNATGRVSVAGRRFPSFGALIINVSSLAKTAEYLSTGMPLVERIVTVDGPAVKTPKNFIAPIGTPISHLLKEVELSAGPGKIVIGGPMNGHAVADIDAPITKVANAVLVFGEKESVVPEASACIHCGRCAEVCPVNIRVYDVDHGLRKKNEQERAESLIDTGVRQCVDCASCTYVCPANRPLLVMNQQAKRFLKGYERAQKEKEGAKQG